MDSRLNLEEGNLLEAEVVAGTGEPEEERPALRIHHDGGAAPARPTCRAECATVPRPCPFVSCRYHLYLDVNPRTGRIKFNFPGQDVSEIAVSCALDMAEAGPWTLEDIGARMNITRERARQLAEQALVKIKDGIDTVPHQDRTP